MSFGVDAAGAGFAASSLLLLLLLLLGSVVVQESRGTPLSMTAVTDFSHPASEGAAADNKLLRLLRALLHGWHANSLDSIEVLWTVCGQVCR